MGLDKHQYDLGWPRGAIRWVSLAPLLGADSGILSCEGGREIMGDVTIMLGGFSLHDRDEIFFWRLKHCTQLLDHNHNPNLFLDVCMR